MSYRPFLGHIMFKFISFFLPVISQVLLFGAFFAYILQQGFHYLVFRVEKRPRRREVWERRMFNQSILILKKRYAKFLFWLSLSNLNSNNKKLVKNIFVILSLQVGLVIAETAELEGRLGISSVKNVDQLTCLSWLYLINLNSLENSLRSKTVQMLFSSLEKSLWLLDFHWIVRLILIVT